MYAPGQSRGSFPSASKIFTPAVTAIVILSIAGCFSFVFAPSFTMNFLAISAQNLSQGRIWQLVTYPFVSNSPVNMIFTLLMILFVGSNIERQWRTASFLMLWVVVSAVCGLLWVIVTSIFGSNAIGFGATSCVYGLFATMGLLYRGRRFSVFFTTVPSEQLVFILIAIGILMNITRPINLVWMSGALVAYIYVKLVWRKAQRKRTNITENKKRRATGFVDID